MFLEVSPLELELRGYSKEMAVLCGDQRTQLLKINIHELHRFTDHDCFVLLYW